MTTLLQLGRLFIFFRSTLINLDWNYSVRYKSLVTIVLLSQITSYLQDVRKPIFRLPYNWPQGFWAILYRYSTYSNYTLISENEAFIVISMSKCSHFQ